MLCKPADWVACLLYPEVVLSNTRLNTFTRTQYFQKGVSYLSWMKSPPFYMTSPEKTPQLCERWCTGHIVVTSQYLCCFKICCRHNIMQQSTPGWYNLHRVFWEISVSTATGDLWWNDASLTHTLCVNILTSWVNVEAI